MRPTRDEREPAPRHEAQAAPLPSWITPDLVELTIRVWRPIYGASFGREQAIALLLNVGRLLSVVAGGRSP